MITVEFLKIIAGIGILCLPGFVWSYIFFKKRDLAPLERAVLSFGLGISLTTIAMFIANKLLGVPINSGSVWGILLLLTLAASFLLLRAVKPSLVKLKSWDMRRQSLRRVSLEKVPEYLGLCVLLIFVFFMTYIPHLSYEYLLHIDEWNHFALSQALVNAEGFGFVEPFFGEILVTDHPEAGFHLFLGQIKLLTGLSWMVIFRILPALIFVTTSMAAFIFGRRRGYGLEVVFFVALIPTTIRMLGPSFLVPVSLGLFFLPLVLFQVHYFEMSMMKLVALILLLSFLFLLHPPSAFIVSLVPVSHAVVHLFEKGHNLRKWLAAFRLWGAVTVASSVIWLRLPTAVMERIEWAIEYPVPQFGYITGVLPKFGYLPTGFFLLGLGLLAYRWQLGKRNLVILCCCYLLMTQLYERWQIGIGVVYERTWLYFLIIAAIMAGYAFYETRLKCQSYFQRFSLPVVPMAIAVSTILIVTSVILAVNQRFQEPYYHLVDDESYAEMVWIQENVDAAYQVALVDPRVAIVFTPLTGRFIYVGDAAFIFQEERLAEAMNFLRDQATDTQWLREREIDMVYTRLPVDNPDLIKLREHIYVLPR